MRDEKLLYVLNHYSPTASSHFSHVMALLEEMAGQGTDVMLLIEKGEEPAGVTSPRIRVAVLPTTSGAVRWFALVRAVLAAGRLGYRTVFVRISAWTALGAIVASIVTRGRVFFWQSGTTLEFDRAQPLSVAKVRWMLRTWLPSRLVWHLCHRFVTGPATMVEYFATVGRVPRRRLRLLHNDVDHRRFVLSDPARAQARERVRAQLGIADDDTVLLFVHRFSPVRRTLEYLPAALERARGAGLLTQVVAVFLGGGSDEGELRRRADAAGLSDHVRFLGDVPNIGIEQVYAAADLFMQPSHAEGFPRSLLEAMVAGLPVVTTDAGGSSELLGERQQAYVSPKDDFRAFDEALVALLRARSDWPALAEENRRRAAAFDTPAVAAMYRRVLFHE